MSDISFGGLATGLPTEELISSFMEVEKSSLYRLQDEKSEESKKLEAYEEYGDLLDKLRESVSGMHLTSEMRQTDVSIKDDAPISVTSDGAATGNHTVAVQQLAQVQKTVSDGVSSRSESVFSEGQITLGDTVIVVDENNNSLAGIMDSINSLTAETGITASIIDDGSDSGNYHLVMTGNDASTDFSFGTNLTVTENGETGGFAATHTSTAQQAIAYVDGVKVVSNSNTLNDTISGLNISLNEVSEVLVPADETTGANAILATTTINVEPDTDSVKEKITEFVTAYNNTMEWIVSGYEYKADDTSSQSSSDSSKEDDDDKDTKVTGELSSLLRGDASINNVKRDLQNIFGDSVNNSGSYQILAEIGLETQQDGTLYINSSKLDDALDSNYEDVITLMAGDSTKDGAMDKFNTALLSHTSATTGLYAGKEDTYESKENQLDTQIERQESRLKKIELQYRSQFTSLELLVSSLNQQSSFLTNYFSNNSGS